jgi:hypothetical protein
VPDRGEDDESQCADLARRRAESFGAPISFAKIPGSETMKEVYPTDRLSRLSDCKRHLLHVSLLAFAIFLTSCTPPARQTAMRQQGVSYQQAIASFPSEWQKLKVGMSPTEVSKVLSSFQSIPPPDAVEAILSGGGSIQAQSPDFTFISFGKRAVYNRLIHPYFQLTFEGGKLASWETHDL